ncbi:hypothetical protein AVEN_230016-1 [Araneus ventricosus]|uniref:Uncharacterized protein n=1 Tax=Araneus ventricosus TaxID=182803 RepID=A0A4Y2CUH9_ARAVE|nr:hypothetical protein AVEN_230016-1 [Araneus ventricosus]
MRSPNRSACKRSSELVLSNRSVKRILYLDSHFLTYKLVVVHQLKPENYAQRLNFSYEMEAIFEQNHNLISPMNDEARFHLNVIISGGSCYAI